MPRPIVTIAQLRVEFEDIITMLRTMDGDTSMDDFDWLSDAMNTFANHMQDALLHYSTEFKR